MPKAKEAKEQEIANEHKVPKSQWKKWNPQQQSIFNEVFYTMVMNQDIFQHPKAAPIPPEHWATCAWNAGWTAADAAKS